MRTVSLPLRGEVGPVRSKRLLALVRDERLVAHVRTGSEAAFEVLYERYGRGILGFCRHMLGSREEAEDAVQQVFASAYRDLLRDEHEIRLRPWLYTIARNRCRSMLRARRDEVSAEVDLPAPKLDHQLERRAELRQLLRDLRDLPDEQRVALLLSEAGGLTHAEVAEVLGCEVPRVKALVFRARTGLMQRRQGRELPCADVREQLANLRGGSLRRSELRHHLHECPGCREFREEVKRQRALMAAALPVTPSLGLKASVLSAAGLGGGSGGGGAAAGGAGLAGALSAGAGTVVKLGVLGALIGGGVLADHEARHGSASVEGTTPARAASVEGTTPPATRAAGSTSPSSSGDDRRAPVRRHARGGATRRAERNRGASQHQVAITGKERGRSEQAPQRGRVAAQRPASTAGGANRRQSQQPTTPTTTSRQQPEPTITLPDAVPKERSRRPTTTTPTLDGSATGY